MKDDRFGLERRRFLMGGLGALGAAALTPKSTFASPGCLKPGLAEGEIPNTLVIVELSGGNDGLSTIVPYGDDVYHASRTTTLIDPKTLLPLDDYRGFHPHLKGMRDLWERGELAIVEGVGYPKPNLSHFASQDVWYTGSARGRAAGDGWIGKLMDAAWGEDTQPNRAMYMGRTLPYSMQSSNHPVVSLGTPSLYRWADDADRILSCCDKRQEGNDVLEQLRAVVRNAASSSESVRRAAATYRPRVNYPGRGLSKDLKTLAALINARIGCRILAVTQGAYDTHERQKERHDNLVSVLDGSLAAFMDDLRGTEAGDKTVVMVFSEFGRRVADNGSLGTDHGTAGPMFVLGSKVKGGLYGKHPSLEALDDGNLVHTTDFRSVYASVIQGVFGVDPKSVLGATYPTLPVLA